nr:hypothetical protein [Tanacetum cinerariifolium]
MWIDMKKVKSTKWVKVEYTWKPDRCTHCKVFGHSVHACDVKPKAKPTVYNNARSNKGDTNIGASQEGFVEVKNTKNNNKKVWNKDPQQPNGVKVAYRPKEANEKPLKDKQNRTKQTEGRPRVNKDPNVWNVGQDNVAELRKSANGYAVLSDDENNTEVDHFNDKRLIVDEFIKKKIQPTYQATQSFIANEIVGNVTGADSGECNWCRGRYCKWRNLWNELNMHKNGAHGIFLPYPDHNSPAIMTIPKGISKKKKSFRFSNYVADKEEFLDVVRERWNHDVRGCQMYRVVQKLKLLKNPLNQLNWQTEKLFENFYVLKEKLKEAQSKVDADPFNSKKRE